MSNFIPQHTLEQIQDSLDIIEVIDEYVRLKKSGKNYKALCPFHVEKTPSFIVSPEKRIYHCFGCGEGGNMFNFIMKYLNVSFPEAAKMLANKAGVEIPSSYTPQQDTLIDKLYEINKMAAKFYHKKLSQSKKAIHYLYKRGFSKKLIPKFLIGYAPDSWDSLFNFLKERGLSGELLEEAGLVIARDSGGWYDRFRNRIVFPILDICSRVLGFGARALDESSPKYINSPETKIYSKREHLYGLNFAKSFIREKDFVIVVEGYTDVLSLYQVGIKNVVSNLGTALTQRHIRTLKRFTDNVVMVYDSDEAGKIASLRNLDLLIENDMRVKLTCLPADKDPDDYVREFGQARFLELISNAKDLLDYKLHILDYESKNSDIHKKKEIIEDILLTIGRVNDHILRTEYLKRLSDFININEDVLRRKLGSLYKRSKTKVNNSVNFERTNIMADKNNFATERLLLRAMLESEEGLKLGSEKISVDDLMSPIIKKIIKTVIDQGITTEDMNLDRLMGYVDDEECNKLLANLFCEFETMPKHIEILNDCVKRIQLSKLDSQLAKLKRKLKQADKQQEKELLFSYNNLRKVRENLRK